jgi:single-strand DNA-binding protein
MNQCNLIGNLTKDVELKHTQSGVAIASFSIACNERYTDKQGNKVEKVEFVNVVAWNKLAEICSQYLHKGDKVFISGKMETRKWQDKEGKDRWTTEIIAKEMEMLGGKGGGSNRDDQSGGQGGYAPQGGGTGNQYSCGNQVPF